MRRQAKSGRMEARTGKTPDSSILMLEGFQLCAQGRRAILVKEVEADIWAAGPGVLTNVGGDN